MNLKVDDKVRWRSQSHGTSSIKIGKILSIVPPGKRAVLYGYKTRGGWPGNPRNHESYVVLVGRWTYWPRVSQLRKVGLS